MKLALAVLASILFLSAARPAAAPAMADFRLKVERTTAGWQMHCAQGCTWTDLSLGCHGDCRALVDEAGITTEIVSAPRATGFAFVIGKTSKGWTAKSVRGAAWQQLTWGCALASCRAQLDGSGVSGL